MINDSLHSMLITSYNTNQIKISIIVIIASFVRKDFNYLKKNIKPHVIANGLTNWGTITFWHPVPWSFIRRILECMVAISPELKTIKIARLFFFSNQILIFSFFVVVSYFIVSQYLKCIFLHRELDFLWAINLNLLSNLADDKDKVVFQDFVNKF